MSSKVDYTQLDTTKLMGLTYSSDFVALPFDEKYFKDQDNYHYLSNLFEELQGRKPQVLPCVVHAADSLFQDIIPLRGYLSDQSLTVMWGGYSNQGHWLNIPQENYSLVVKREGTLAKFEDIEIELVEPKETVSLKKAEKLSSLEIGDYKIQSVKAVNTSYGLTYIVVMDDKEEYWANKQLTRLIGMLGDVSKVKDMTLKVISKSTTSQGNLSVRVGLYK